MKGFAKFFGIESTVVDDVRPGNSMKFPVLGDRINCFIESHATCPLAPVDRVLRHSEWTEDSVIGRTIIDSARFRPIEPGRSSDS